VGVTVGKKMFGQDLNIGRCGGGKIYLYFFAAALRRDLY